MNDVNLKKFEQVQEMLTLFFEDSIQPLLVVSAQSQKIIHANESLIKLLEVKKNVLQGMQWYDLDCRKIEKKYSEHVKEINSNEKVSFLVHYKKQNSEVVLSSEYHLGFLDGEMVYVGQIKLEQASGFSNEIVDQINTINSLEVCSSSLKHCIEELKVLLNLKFIVYIEGDNILSKKELIVSNTETKNKIKTLGFSTFIELSESSKNIEINELSQVNNKYFKLISLLKVDSLMVFPIYHHKKMLGTIVVGTQNNDNNQMVSFLMSALVSRCRLCLYEQSIISLRNKEGQVDKLTNLPNRNSMTEKLTEIIEQGVEPNYYLSLMIIDFEKLNFYNKRFGMEITDEIIVNISHSLTKVIGSNGQVYRLSGNEFLVLLKPYVEKRFAEHKCQEIIDIFSHSILLSNAEEVAINCNVGVSIFPDDGQTVASMMKNADMALYDSKLKGKNNYIIFKFSETGQALKQKIEMEENLKLALNTGNIKVFFQPKIDAISEDIIGFEALVRWIDPELGMINPGQFIPLAEETGLINDLGEYIAKRSCEKLIEWQRKFGLILTCSINLSVVQLMDNKLPKTLEKIINSSGIHPHYIDFEITETISLDVVPNLMQVLNEIVSIGCTLSIDDFGTGHSSLDYVKKIPARFIKIDQSFVANIGLNPEDEAILDATINIAKRLNRKIIAEGVETEEQREYLVDRECEYFQGFLFSKPLPEEEVEKLLEQRVKLMGLT